MSDIKEAIENAVPESSLNSRVATLVAVVATLMAIGNIKDGNIVQNMSQANSRAVGQWNYYQAKSTKEILADNGATQLRAQLPGVTGAAHRETVEKAIAKFEAEAKRYSKEKEEIKKQAEGFEAEYDRLNVHDDQLDMAEACFTIAITMAGISALTKKDWLFRFATMLGAIGVFLEAAAFLRLAFHPEWLAKLLG